jgi:hypothetical protein
VPGKHLTGNLGVAGLVGADQSDGGEAEEEEKAAETGEQKELAQAGLAARHGEQCTACGMDSPKWEGYLAEARRYELE